MDERRLKGLMGLCVRAGAGVFGEEGCRKALTKGEAVLLLLDESASASTQKRYEQLCRQAGIRLQMLPEGLLQSATGKPGVAMAVRNGSFATQMIGCLSPDNGT